MNRLVLLLLFWGILAVGWARANFRVTDTVFVQRFDTLCQGDTLKLFGQKYSKTGKYRYNKPPIKPTRDTTIIINLWVKPRYVQQVLDTLCQGEQLKIGTQQFSSTGSYTIVFPANRRRCDSTILLKLHVLPIFTQKVRVPLCQGDTMRLGLVQYYYPTVATLRYSARNGCDSVVQYSIEMLDTFRTRLERVVCKGSRVSVGGNSFIASNSGRFLYNYVPNARRCDSTIELHLQVRDTFFTRVQEQICAGDTRRLGPLNLTQSGTYRYTFPANAQRCDSTVALSLSVLPRQEISRQADLCEGDTLHVGSQKLTRAGNYQINLRTREGCDSIVQLSLRLRPRLSGKLIASICMGDRYRFGNRWLTQAGFYTDTLSARSTGCDSVLQLELRVERFERNVIHTSICQGQSYRFDGRNIRTPGVYLDTLLSNSVCPIVFELNLKVNPNYQDTLRTSICQGQSYRFGGLEYTQAGLFPQRLKTAQGCDSVRVLQLGVLPSYRDTLRTPICVGDTFRFGQLKLYREGHYPIRFNARNGCDSTLVIKIVHHPLQRDTFPVSLCAGDTFRLGRVKYFQTGLYPITLRDRNACDSILYIKITRHQEYLQDFSLNACQGRSIRFGKQILNRSGRYTETFRTQAGCDSVVNLQVKFEPIDTSVNLGGILLSAVASGQVRRYEWVDCATQRVVSGQSSPFFLPEKTGAYAARLYTDSCVYTSGCHWVQLATSSIQLDVSGQVYCYPNPTSGQLQILLPEALRGEYMLECLNASGQVLRRERRQLGTENTWPTEGLVPGFYVLKLRSLKGKEVAFLKFSKI
jgi:hypothetical protein